jgi:hypothetical protein
MEWKNTETQLRKVGNANKTPSLGTWTGNTTLGSDLSVGNFFNVYILCPNQVVFFFFFNKMSHSEASWLIVAFAIDPPLFWWIVTLLSRESQLLSIKSLLFAGEQLMCPGRILAMSVSNLRPLGCFVSMHRLWFSKQRDVCLCVYKIKTFGAKWRLDCCFYLFLVLCFYLSQNS